jgi:importin-7
VCNLVNELLGCLCTASVFEELHENYRQVLNNLILDVCFMLIRTSPEERQQMYDEPQEFVNLALDTCED